MLFSQSLKHAKLHRYAPPPRGMYICSFYRDLPLGTLMSRRPHRLERICAFQADSYNFTVCLNFPNERSAFNSLTGKTIKMQLDKESLNVIVIFAFLFCFVFVLEDDHQNNNMVAFVSFFFFCLVQAFICSMVVLKVCNLWKC